MTRARMQGRVEDRRKASDGGSSPSASFHRERQADAIAGSALLLFFFIIHNNIHTAYLGVGPEECQLRKDLRHQLLVAKNLLNDGQRKDKGRGECKRIYTRKRESGRAGGDNIS